MDDIRKKELKKQFKEKQIKNLIDSMPISKDKLRELFEYFDNNEPVCDDTLKHTLSFLRENNLDINKIIPWLQENGGNCDCEVYDNLTDTYGSIVGYE